MKNKLVNLLRICPNCNSYTKKSKQKNSSLCKRIKCTKCSFRIIRFFDNIFSDLFIRYNGTLFKISNVSANDKLKAAFKVIYESFSSNTYVYNTIYYSYNFIDCVKFCLKSIKYSDLA